MNQSLAIIVPVFNEASVIVDTLVELQEKRVDDTIIAINDGSSDESLERMKRVPGIYILSHEINLGQGAAIQTGIEFAREEGFKYAVTFDSDGQHCVDDIAIFEREIKSGNYDLIYGSRFLGAAINISQFRKYFLKLSTVFSWLVYGIKLSDSHNGFRIFRLDHPGINLHNRGMAHASEFVDFAVRYKLRYKELPCTVIYTDYSKQKGQSLLNSIDIVVELLVERLIK